MGKENKIGMGDLYWSYSQPTGAIPFIFNDDDSAIMVLSANYRYPVLKLPEDVPSVIEDANIAISRFFRQDCQQLPCPQVIDVCYSKIAQNFRTTLAGGVDNVKFSLKEIEKMRIKFNHHKQQEADAKFLHNTTEQESESSL